MTNHIVNIAAFKFPITLSKWISLNIWESIIIINTIKSMHDVIQLRICNANKSYIATKKLRREIFQLPMSQTIWRMEWAGMKREDWLKHAKNFRESSMITNHFKS